MEDITRREDVVKLVDLFYTKVKADALLAPIFEHVDWEHHTPLIYNFWATVLLGDQSYTGAPFAPHLKLKIDASHFQRWLELFTQTVDENFAGFNANEAKGRAQGIAGVWQHKMGLMGSR
jgi:hemoglobin